MTSCGLVTIRDITIFLDFHLFFRQNSEVKTALSLMRKEVILAIFLGISLGFVITLGIWKARDALKTLPQTSQSILTPTPESPVSESPDNDIHLTLTQPRDNDLVSSDKILVTGETLPNARIVILLEDTETETSADASGKFSQQITLISGSNILTVFAFDDQGNQATQEVSLIYSTAQI